MPVPIALLVDDGAPINPMYWIHPDQKHEFIVPNAFTNDFARVCRRYGVKGKFTVLPMPAGLGRIDERLNYVPQRHLSQFLHIVRSAIAPHFDISPELLTHQNALMLNGNGYHHLFEDAWIAGASTDEISEYLSVALRILKNVGLPANGVTSPWDTGISNESSYAEAVGRAQWRVHRRKLSWYFLHTLTPSNARWPWVAWQNSATRQSVVSVPATTNDCFWATQRMTSRRAALKVALEGADRMLTEDGRRGEIRELFDQNNPIVILTHWQSLFSQGTAAGLRGLETVFARVESALGRAVKWTTCSELARETIKAAITAI
jgi:hypothetical protein